MKKLQIRSALALLASLALACTFMLASAQTASAATYRGGVSIWNACVYQNGTPSYVVLVQQNVMGWRCQYNGGWNAVYLGVSVDRECKRVYGPTAFARYTNFNNPYSWGCYR
jgi:hypothetical protein